VKVGSVSRLCLMADFGICGAEPFGQLYRVQNNELNI
jgi:hypothetical protein